ncbi:DEAD/DEAH box helicase [Nonomuraea sp. SYSU D8015]|uniref:DEAD/DEAH box helicase n=1 Tax=Nonomuraea sp. SYSU D8015 TaxID=2593644 RepID=UPI001660ACE8|nr:DEAD/DEAH box helicase [Nonomuraea sp. SYSU D8015]
MSDQQKLRPHQRDAVDATVAALTRAERATTVMACGTGKTRIGAATAERLLPRTGGSRVLIVAPFLELLTQTIREWRAVLGDAALGRIIAVCSDQRVLDEHAGELHQQHAAVTSDAAELAQLAAGPGGVTVVSTYHSLSVIAAAHENGLPMWHLIIVDEAHRSAGSLGKAWTIVHGNAHLPADRRLYLTATPKVILGGDDIVSMDDAKIFGEVAHRLGFAAARKLGLLAGYQTVVPVVTNEQLRTAARAPQPAEFYQSGRSAIAATMLATQIAVLRAAEEYGIRRLITFHNRVGSAEWFAATLRHAATLLDPGQRPARLWTGHVHGGQPLAQRRTILDRLRSDDDELVVVANARVLGEGIDVPAVDGVAFIDARTSPIDTIQAIGRALRRGTQPGPKTASIIVPVILGPGEDPETALDTSAYASVWQVVRALATHDDDLATHLSTLRRRLGTGSARTDATDSSEWPLPDWLRITGVPVPPGFANAITVRTVRASTHSWEEYYGAAQAYSAEFGDLLVPDGWQTPSGLKLANWLHHLRTYKKAGSLAPAWIARMDALGMVWDVREHNRQRVIAECAKYHQKHGDLLVPSDYTTDDDPPYPLGSVVSNTRVRYLNGTLDPGFAAKLTALGMVWHVPDTERAQFLADLDAYRKTHGDLDVPQQYVTPGPNPRKLGRKVAGMRRRWREGTLTKEEIKELEQRGFIWDALEHRFNRYLHALHVYKRTHNGSVEVPQKYVTPPPEKLTLGRWLSQEKARYRRGEMLPHRAKALRAAGVRLPPRRF